MEGQQTVTQPLAVTQAEQKIDKMESLISTIEERSVELSKAVAFPSFDPAQYDSGEVTRAIEAARPAMMAADQYLSEVQRGIKHAEGQLAEILDPLKEAMRRVKLIAEPKMSRLEAAKATLKDVLKSWANAEFTWGRLETARKERIERKKAEDERLRLAAEAEAKAKVEREIQAKREAEQRKAREEAEKAEREGKAKAAEAARAREAAARKEAEAAQAAAASQSARADNLITAPIFTKPVAPATAPMKTQAKSSVKVTWKVRVTDAPAFYRALADGMIDPMYAPILLPPLEKLARAMDGKLPAGFLGIATFEDVDVSASSR